MLVFLLKCEPISNDINVIAIKNSSSYLGSIDQLLTRWKIEEKGIGFESWRERQY